MITNEINEYDKYRKLEELPVKTTVVLPPKDVRRIGIMQFHHGMGEHSKRYTHVLKYFSEKGYVCAIHDAAGHGESMKNDSELGYFGSDGANKVVEDMHAVTVYLKNNYPDLPIIVIGHSFGSLVTRAYLKKYDYEVDRAFIVGSPSDNKYKTLGMLLIELITIFKNEKEVSEFVSNSFDKQFDKVYRKYCEENNKEYKKNGMVCSKPEVVDKYNSDTKCGFAYTLNGYYTIMDVMRIVYNGNPEKWVRKNKKLEITFLSGRDDMYLQGEENLKKAVERMKLIGYENVDYIMYDNMFHEIFNEDDNIKVFEDIMEKCKKISY